MRVIAGTYRSRQLVAPRGLQTRPTSDRLRERLFNILSPRVSGCRFVDLYAGTGAVGIEALSRGATHVWFAENAEAALASIRQNLAALKIVAGFTVEDRGVGAMLTNFHLPRTSLLLLVCAFAGTELALAAYRHAVEAEYRFYSYGDCMLIV